MKIITEKNRARLRLDEEVDIRKLRWFYQESDTGSQFVSPVAPEIRELFNKVSKHLEKAHNIKATKVSCMPSVLITTHQKRQHLQIGRAHV